jgi:hypothetical protein
MSQQSEKGFRASLDGKEGTVRITDKSILFEEVDGITGVERSAIRMVKTNDKGELVVAYADGANVKSVRIKPLDASPADLLLALKDQNVPQEVFDEEFERLFQDAKNNLETKLQRAMKGEPYKMPKAEASKWGSTWRKMEEILNRRFNIPKWIYPVWEVRNMPREYQVGWAKYMYVSQTPALIQFVSDYSESYVGQKQFGGHVPYQGGYGEGHEMWPEDWERFFLHFGVIDVPRLTEEVKARAREFHHFSTSQNTVPPDFKAWF